MEETSEGTKTLVVSPSGAGTLTLKIYELTSAPGEERPDLDELGGAIISVASQDRINLTEKRYAFSPGSYAAVYEFGGSEEVVGIFMITGSPTNTG